MGARLSGNGQLQLSTDSYERQLDCNDFNT